MTGRSLHDTLLRILSNGPLRVRLCEGHEAAPGIGTEEWHVLNRLPNADVQNMARFLARHYYGERIVRLFRHVRRLAPRTGCDPLALLDSPAMRRVLDHAVLGSPDTADAIVALMEMELLRDGSIQQQFPYWQDLVRYQATMFRLEARRSHRPASERPRRSDSAQVVAFEWDLPALIVSFPSCDERLMESLHHPSLLLIASSADGHVTSLRCTSAIRRLFEAADGTRTIDALAAPGRFSISEAERILGQMKAIGAIHWNETVKIGESGRSAG